MFLFHPSGAGLSKLMPALHLQRQENEAKGGDLEASFKRELLPQQTQTLCVCSNVATIETYFPRNEPPYECILLGIDCIIIRVDAVVYSTNCRIVTLYFKPRCIFPESLYSQYKLVSLVFSSNT